MEVKVDEDGEDWGCGANDLVEGDRDHGPNDSVSFFFIWRLYWPTVRRWKWQCWLCTGGKIGRGARLQRNAAF